MAADHDQRSSCPGGRSFESTPSCVTRGRRKLPKRLFGLRLPDRYHMIPRSLRRDWTRSQSFETTLSMLSRTDSTAEYEVLMNRATASSYRSLSTRDDGSSPVTTVRPVGGVAIVKISRSIR